MSIGTHASILANDSVSIHSNKCPTTVLTVTPAFAATSSKGRNCLSNGNVIVLVPVSRIEGADAVRLAFAAAWRNFPDAQWHDGRHFVAGNRGVSEWRFFGTGLDGKIVEADGVDIFTFRDGKIHIKNAFRKQRTAL